MQMRPNFWSGGTSGGSAAHSVFCAERNSRSGCPCSLHCLLQNGLKFGFRAYGLFASRSRDWTELECAVLKVLSWLLRRAGNTCIIRQGKARHTHTFRMVYYTAVLADLLLSSSQFR